MLKVGILLGDDIGLEVVPEAVKVMKAVAAKTGLQLDWQPLPIDRKSHEATGLTVPPSTVEEVAKLDGWLMGPIGHSLYPRNDPTWATPDFRKRFDLFASVKPVRSYATIEDVVMTTNLFGDILTDEGAALVGGLGLALGLCIGERQAMAQATHGSAPDIAAAL